MGIIIDIMRERERERERESSMLDFRLSSSLLGIPIEPISKLIARVLVESIKFSLH